jgi:hypothetical protein
MADQKQIKLWPGNADPTQIVLRELPVADSQPTTIYLYQGNATAQNITLRNPRVIESSGGTADYIATVSGGVALSGANDGTVGIIGPVGGGVALAGGSDGVQGITYASAGGAELGGAAAAVVGLELVGSGGVTLAGGSAEVFGVVAAASGGIALDGEAGVEAIVEQPAQPAVSSGGGGGRTYGYRIPKPPEEKKVKPPPPPPPKAHRAAVGSARVGFRVSAVAVPEFAFSATVAAIYRPITGTAAAKRSVSRTSVAEARVGLSGLTLVEFVPSRRHIDEEEFLALVA